MLQHQGCVSYNRIICSRGIQVVLSTFKPNQPDTKGLPPAQGRNPSHNDRFCHQKAGSSLNKIGKGLIATSRLDLLWWKLTMGRFATLQVTSAFPKWIISDRRLPTSSGTCISCPSLFLLLKSKILTGKARGNFLVSFIKSQDWRT